MRQTRDRVALLEYTWVDGNGSKENATDKIRVPCDPNDPPNRTRSQTAIREPPIIKNNRNKRLGTDGEVAKSNKQNATLFSHKVCKFINCKINGRNGMKFRRIPSAPEPMDDNIHHRNVDRMKHEVRRVFANECCRRIGRPCCPRSIGDKKKDIRICALHQIEKIVKDVEWLDNDLEKNIIKATMYVPSSVGVAYTTAINHVQQQSQQQQGRVIRENRGLGSDWLIARQLQSIDNNTGLLLTQIYEHAEGNLQVINPTIARAAGIEVVASSEKIRVEVPQNLGMLEQEETVVRLNDLSDDLVKITTGFPTVILMVSFIILVNKGKIQDIFETVWCKNSTRWVDLEIRFNTSSKTLRTIFDHKRDIHMKCVSIWPKFVSYVEDNSLRKIKWDEHYRDRRVIMWENTNVPFCYKPSASDVQRNKMSLREVCSSNLAVGWAHMIFGSAL
jgi:hypothetical protein